MKPLQVSLILSSGLDALPRPAKAAAQ